MNNEARMWLQQLELANSDWEIGFGRTAHIGAGALSNDCYVYTVDTSSGWLCAGALPQAEMSRVCARLQKEHGQRTQVMDLCGSAILDAGRMMATHDSPEAEACVALAVGALTQTQTWQLVQERLGSPVGHWLYVVYSLHEPGRILGRPGFVRRQAPGLLDTAELMGMVASMVAADMESTTSSVGRDLAGGGGPILAPMFKLASGSAHPRNRS